MRGALWTSAVFNLVGAVAFAFPASLPGQLAGLPTAVPPLYRALLAMFALLFGGCYAWLAMQPIIPRAMVALAAIGKSAAFVVIVGCWLAGHAADRGVLTAVGELGFALIFFAWLRRSAST
jgi:hypothetical protein